MSRLTQTLLFIGIIVLAGLLTWVAGYLRFGTWRIG
jgi:hypothetical protein